MVAMEIDLVVWVDLFDVDVDVSDVDVDVPGMDMVGGGDEDVGLVGHGGLVISDVVLVVLDPVGGYETLP